MMAINACPVCGHPIAPADINVAEGVGLCRACGKLSRLADIIDQPIVDPAFLKTPPAGCSYEEQLNGGFVIRASQRSIVTAMATLVVCLFWNGIVSVFVLLALGGLYRHFLGPLPSWFPSPQTKHANGTVDPEMPGSSLLFLCIFLIPFVTIGLCLFLAFIASLLGEVKVTVDRGEGKVQRGVGPFRWTRGFDASAVTRVTETQSKFMVNNQTRPLIVLDSNRTIRFGSMLPDYRRTWMVGVLRMQLMLRRKAGG